MLKIAIKHYRVPLWAVEGRRKGPPFSFVPDAERRHKKMAVSNRGGKTIATVTDTDDGHLVATGVSVCSMSDNFDYKVGVEKAILMSGYAVDQSLATQWADAKRDFYRRLHDIPRAIKTVPTITEHNDLGVGVGPAMQFDVALSPNELLERKVMAAFLETIRKFNKAINDFQKALDKKKEV